MLNMLLLSSLVGPYDNNPETLEDLMIWVYTDHRLSRAEMLIRERDYEILFYIIHEQ
jgi:hypothetical protein